MAKSKVPFQMEQEYIIRSADGARISKIVQLGYWGDDKSDLRLKICKVKDGRISNGVTLNDEDVRQLRMVLLNIDFGK